MIQIKQICVAGGTTEYPDALYALTEDGRVFRQFCDGNRNKRWELMQIIEEPQPNK